MKRRRALDEGEGGRLPVGMTGELKPLLASTFAELFAAIWSRFFTDSHVCRSPNRVSIFSLTTKRGKSTEVVC
jgi:hypothetical protein